MVPKNQEEMLKFLCRENRSKNPVTSLAFTVPSTVDTEEFAHAKKTVGELILRNITYYFVDLSLV